MKKNYILSLLCGVLASAQAQPYNETFGTVAGVVSVASHASYTSSSSLTFTGFGSTLPDIRNYSGEATNGASKSGGAGVYIPNVLGSGLQIDGINTSGITSPALSFGILKHATTFDGANFSVQYSVNASAGDGATWTPLPAISPLPTAAGWYYPILSGLPQSTTLSLRFMKIISAAQYYWIDDIMINELATLPISLSSFSVKKEKGQAILKWTTASESNNSYFAVERSVDGVNFSVIGTKYGAGTSSVTQTYTFTDFNPVKGINYYRLLQYDQDHHSAMYGIQAVNFSSNDLGLQLLVNDNPQQVTFIMPTNKGGSAELSLYSIDGKKVLSQIIAVKEGDSIYTINIPYLKSGIYSVVCQSGNDLYVEKLIK